MQDVGKIDAYAELAVDIGKRGLERLAVQPGGNNLFPTDDEVFGFQLVHALFLKVGFQLGPDSLGGGVIEGDSSRGRSSYRPALIRNLGVRLINDCRCLSLFLFVPLLLLNYTAVSIKMQDGNSRKSTDGILFIFYIDGSSFSVL